MGCDSSKSNKPATDMAYTPLQILTQTEDFVVAKYTKPENMGTGPNPPAYGLGIFTHPAYDYTSKLLEKLSKEIMKFSLALNDQNGSTDEFFSRLKQKCPNLLILLIFNDILETLEERMVRLPYLDNVLFQSLFLSMLECLGNLQKYQIIHGNIQAS